MSSHVPSPASSPAPGPHNSHEATFRGSQASNPDSSGLSLESSFQLESPEYSSQRNDAERHPKGKRKRTTNQDKTILEAAYNANPKPDKAARLDLVKRVTLNEKEVQIWFQNRRQNDRRKSRPLSPQEIAALRYGGGIHVMSSDPALFGGMDGVDGREETRPAEADRRSASPIDASSQDVSQLSQESSGTDSAEVKLDEDDRRHSVSGATPPPPRRFSTDTDALGGAQTLSQSLPTSVGYLSNRWNAGTSFSTPSTLSRGRDDSFRLESFPLSAASTADNSPASILPPPSSSSSKFRLSLSLEGKAELVSSQPSPPRPAHQQQSVDATTLAPVRAPRILQRSRSALPGITLPPISSLTANLPPQFTRGRSRDVHAWESCCQADTRDELTTLAENESSGSAVAAISLLRSSSQTASLSNLVHGHTPSSVMRTSSTKRNAPPGRRDVAKKPKLSRTSSSIARMQSLPPVRTHTLENPNLTTDEVDQAKKANKASLSAILSPSGADSDKENWSPDEDGNPMARRRPLPSVAPTKAPLSLADSKGKSRRAGRVLGEQGVSKRQLLGSRANTAPVPRARGGKALVDSSVLIFEDSGKENSRHNSPRPGKRSDDEVERFMRGEVSPSKKGDVDCVAGLLALSQGNWR